MITLIVLISLTLAENLIDLPLINLDNIYYGTTLTFN